MKDIFNLEVTQGLLSRIGRLNEKSEPNWGKMDAAQMLAHCSVAYQMVYEPDLFPKPSLINSFILKLLVKKTVVGDQPYKKNSRTAPAFIISKKCSFDVEAKKLIGFINKTQELGRDHFDNKESHSFGKLSAYEWNNMFYKHIDHHLKQFGV